MVYLSDLKKNQKAKIKNIQSNFLQKLMAMGLILGTEIQLLRFAPGGDPIEFEIKGYNLSLRKVACSHVEVELVE